MDKKLYNHATVNVCVCVGCHDRSVGIVITSCRQHLLTCGVHVVFSMHCRVGVVHIMDREFCNHAKAKVPLTCRLLNICSWNVSEHSYECRGSHTTEQKAGQLAALTVPILITCANDNLGVL